MPIHFSFFKMLYINGNIEGINKYSTMPSLIVVIFMFLVFDGYYSLE